MVKLQLGRYHSVIVLHKEFLTFIYNEKRNNWEFQKIVKFEEKLEQSNDACVESCTFSPCGKYFVVSFDKNIIIYETTLWNALHFVCGERKVSCLRFFPQSKKLLVANKSGFTTFYSFEENELKKIEGSIGHNSMLTSALISPNERFIITSDRDEKVRVTNYPNTYNIERFCLGHKQFICWLGFLPSNNKILISGSGDGTIKFWDYMYGKELASYDFNNFEENNESSREHSTVIVKITTCERDSMSVLAVKEYKSSEVKILEVKTEETKILSIQVLDVLKLPCIPWDITFFREHLICILPNKSEPLLCWSVVKKNFEDSFQFKNFTKYLMDNYEFIVKRSQLIYDIIPVLYKREVDNVQEYQKRKKARLLKTGKTS